MKNTYNCTTLLNLIQSKKIVLYLNVLHEKEYYKLTLYRHFSH